MIVQLAVLILMCQEREAALDAVMDKIRQEATEAGLKDGLKKALQMLDTIRTRCVYLQHGCQPSRFSQKPPDFEVDITIV